MAILQRRPLASAALIAITLYVVFVWTPHHIGWSASKPAPPSANSNRVPARFQQDAHQFSNADAFLPHFKAVTKMAGMTMNDAKEGCTWPAPDQVNFQFSEHDQWVKTDWITQDKSDQELEMARRQWHDYINDGLLPWSKYKDRFKGRGIIIVAGNQKSMKRVRVILRALTKLKSKLPIEIHYWGDEMSEESQRNISSMWSKMYFNDLSASTNIIKTNHNGNFINYQLKTAAVINSRFAEPLLLDSDNIPVIDPAELYKSSTYREYGTLFWPDIARTRPNNPMWPITNTACRMNEYEQESGQMIVDKRRFFYHLQLAAWFNNEQGAYYNNFLLGDKDTFRFAWHALKTKYGSPPKWLTSVGTLSPDGKFYCGHSFAQYHPDGRVAFLHGGLVKAMPKEVIDWNRKDRGGIFQAYKTSDFDEKHDVIVNVAIKGDAAEYLPDRPEDMGGGMCTDMFDVEAQPLDQLVPGFEKSFEEYGGYWMLED